MKTLKQLKAEMMQDPEFVAAYEALRPEFEPLMRQTPNEQVIVLKPTPRIQMEEKKAA